MPNKVNPKKLLHSKWTAVRPINKQKHFVIVSVEYDEEQVVVDCQIQAIMSKEERFLDWHDLKDDSVWRQGWH
ncbi:TIGR02450 family Trp-rich protein [Glaciecola sp. XM2]|jgi:tryptophan-rich hypothetical protein|uniref:TIGR02450 family Trp-rich protein n=1 Tax=Glaciecola sp. XM2 TaxID=1914931 RepID=UPI001BDE1535|nr:TIGR02450 family Trp-rich protein [Glaciecola sp. XM2]MBT1449501.1 TIGR02450 family Trp-rich protein [Glaciecola sp. XM2]